MPEFRTDDDIYRTRRVWLGPTGYTLPWHLPYAWYGVFVALYALAALAAWPLVGAGWAVTCGSIAAPATALVFRYVNPDRPAHQVIGTWLRGWQQTTPPPAGDVALPQLTARRVQIAAPRPLAITARPEGDRHVDQPTR